MLADFRIGDRIVRPSLGEIVKGDEAVRVEPRSIDVLVALAQRGRAVYPKRELIEAVWGETFVTDEVLTHAIWDLRKAFGDNASDPRFIQTIPKRGYRLIAAVKAIEPEADAQPEADEASHRRLPWAALGAALAFATTIALITPAGTLEPEASPSPISALDPTTLAVVPSSSSLYDLEQSKRLAEDLRSELAGRPGLLTTRADSCDRGFLGAGDHCLEVRVTELAAGYEARIDLLRDGSSVWAPGKQPLTSVSEASESLAAQVAAYFELIDMPYYHDPDSHPWIDISRHDTRAVVAFLKGMELVYENEVGGGELLDHAIEIDPRFIAPRIVRIPTLVANADHEQFLEHLERLRDLETLATPFEKVMIKFAEAHTRGALAEEIRWLRAALRSARGHRPVTYLLASRLLEDGQLEKACRKLAELVDSRWQFPPLYTDAVSCRIRLGQVEAARAACDAALELEHVDPQLLMMRALLAVYDEEPATEQIYRSRLEDRITQIAPEPFEFDPSPLQERLAQLADEAGRASTAQRVREFSR